MSGERAETKLAFTFSITSWEQPILQSTAGKGFTTPEYARKWSTSLEKLEGSIDQLPPTNPAPEDVPSREHMTNHPFHQAKAWLKTHWLAWKVEFTAWRLVAITLHAPSRDVAMGLLNICRFKIGQMPPSSLRDGLYIYTDLAVNRVEDRFGGRA